MRGPASQGMARYNSQSSPTSTAWLTSPRLPGRRDMGVDLRGEVGSERRGSFPRGVRAGPGLHS